MAYLLLNVLSRVAGMHLRCTRRAAGEQEHPYHARKGLPPERSMVPWLISTASLGWAHGVAFVAPVRQKKPAWPNTFGGTTTPAYSSNGPPGTARLPLS